MRTVRISDFGERQFRAAESITRQAKRRVGETYGTGYGTGSLVDLPYRNLHHTDGTVKGTDAMADALGLSRTERAIGRTAAASHDVVRQKPRGIMEWESGDWLVGQMRRRKLFSRLAIGTAALAVYGTEPLLENDNYAGQVVTAQEYPSRQSRDIALSVACGDFSELYSPLGPFLGHELYKEEQGYDTKGCHR